VEEQRGSDVIGLLEGWRVSLHDWPQYIDPFRAAHPRIKTNKASINFKLGDELPAEDVKGVITRAMMGAGADQAGR